MGASATRRAALWVVTGMALVALSDNFVPMLSEHMGLWQLQMMRSLAVVPVVVLAVLLTGRGALLRARSPRRVIERGALTIFGLMLYFAALPSVGVAQSAAGLFTSPIWVAVFTALLFGQPLGWHRIAAALTGFAGVCLVLGIGAVPLKPMALVAVAGGAFYGLSVIWTRRYCEAESAVCMAVWQFLGFILLGAAGLAVVPFFEEALLAIEGAEFAARPWQALTPFSLVLSFGIGLSGIAATFCVARGYRSAESSYVGIFDFSFLFWAPLFSWLLWGDVLEWRVALGMGLIVAAGVLALLGDAAHAREAAGTPPRADTS